MSPTIAQSMLRSLGAEPFLERLDLVAQGRFTQDSYVMPVTATRSAWCALPEEVIYPYFVDTGLIPPSPVVTHIRGVEFFYTHLNGREGIVASDAHVSYFHLHRGAWIHFRETRPVRKSYNLYEKEIHCIEPQLVRLFSARFPLNPQLSPTQDLDAAKREYARSRSRAAHTHAAR